MICGSVVVGLENNTAEVPLSDGADQVLDS